MRFELKGKFIFLIMLQWLISLKITPLLRINLTRIETTPQYHTIVFVVYWNYASHNSSGQNSIVKRRNMGFDLWIPLLLLLVFFFERCWSYKINHDDIWAPKSHDCNNLIQLVKVKIWIDGVEGTSMVVLTTRFGTPIPTNEGCHA